MVFYTKLKQVHQKLTKSPVFHNMKDLILNDKICMPLQIPTNILKFYFLCMKF
jgi:hypothetical protein